MTTSNLSNQTPQHVTGEKTSLTWAEDLFQRRPWHHDASVHVGTGSLSVYLTHLCALSRQPIRLRKLGSSGIFEFSGPISRLFLVSESPLETVIDPNHDHLFILNRGKGSFIYLVLRRLDALKTYKLVASCTHLFIQYAGIHRFIYPMSINSIAFELNLVRAMLETDMSDKSMEGLSGFFPGAKTGWDTFPTYRGMHDQKDNSSSAFQASYLSCIDSRYSPRIVEGFIILSFTSMPENWPDSSNTGRYLNDSRISIRGPDWNYGVKGSWEKRRWGSWVEFGNTFEFPGFLSPVRVKAPMGLVWDAMQTWFYLLSKIHQVLSCSIDELEALLRHGSSDEKYHLLGSVPERLKDFDADGHTYQVQIL